jgi:translocation and assembly module TamB
MEFGAVPTSSASSDGTRRAFAPARLARWLRRGLLVVGVLVVALAATGALLVHSIDRPWLKHRIQAMARSAGGVDLDYGRVTVGARCAAVEGIVVQSPAEVRNVAPVLLRVGSVEACWSPRARAAPGPSLERLTVSHVTLTVAIDETGKTSFDALSPADPKRPPEPSAPLSQLTSILRKAPPLRSGAIDDVAVVLVRTRGGQPVERLEVDGLAASLSAEPGAGGWRVTVGLGSPAAPLEAHVTRERDGAAAGAARATVWVTADATPSDVRVALDAHVLEQSLVEGVGGVPRLHAEADVAFDPAAKTTTATVHDTRVGEGAVTTEAVLEVPDDGDPKVLHAQGDVDVAELLRWVPAGLVPVDADRARVHVKVDGLTVSSAPRLADGGSASVDADLAHLQLRTQGLPLVVDEATVSLGAHPTEGGAMAAKGTVHIAAVRQGGVAAGGVTLDVDGRRMPDGATTGAATVRFGSAALEGASPLGARDGRVELRLDGVHFDPASPLATRGNVALSADVASFAAGPPGNRVTADGVALHASVPLEGHAPYAADLEAAAARIRLVRGGVQVADLPAKVRVALHDTFVDLARPAASRSTLRATVEAGDLTASLDATKGADALDFALHAAATSLRSLRPFVGAALSDKVAWDSTAAKVQSSGHVERLGSGAPAIDQSTEVDVDHVAIGRTTARSIALTLRSKGDAVRHHADLDVHAAALAIDGGAPSDDHASLAVTVDREGRSMRLELATEGRVAAKLSASASFDRARRAADYVLDAHVGGLAALAPLLAGVPGLAGLDVSQLDVTLSSRGAAVGALTDVGRDGAIALAPHPSTTAWVDGTVDLKVAHFAWTRGDTGIIAPAITWRGELRADKGKRMLESHIALDSLHLDLGPHDVDLSALRDDASIALGGDLADPTMSLKEHTALGNAQQDFAPEYPVGNVAFALEAERDPNGLLHVEDLELTNGASGTGVGLHGNVQLGAGRHSMSLATHLTQDLARLDRAPERFTGRGTLGVEATVVSPDLTELRVRGSVKAHEVDVTVPRAGVEVRKAEGEVPVSVSLTLGKDGLELRREEARSPYSSLRFTDQHPLLNRSGVLSIASLKTPYVTIAPIVGNLDIEQRAVSLRQFEMGVRGGTITGQMGLDWQGPKSTLELHVRATGVQSSHGEPFDGNIAVIVSAGDRSVEGRAEILRIGERHLLDLLDLEDPTHADGAMNRIRTALLFGYPDRLRLSFDHGFASARLELGGLARLASISEIRGIPMGPIIDRLLQPPPNAPQGQP